MIQCVIIHTVFIIIIVLTVHVYIYIICIVYSVYMYVCSNNVFSVYQLFLKTADLVIEHI